MNPLLTCVIVAVLAMVAYRNPLIQQMLNPSIAAEARRAMESQERIERASQRMFDFAQANPLPEFPEGKLPIPKSASAKDKAFLEKVHKDLVTNIPVAWMGKEINVKIESISDLAHVIMAHYLFYSTGGGGATLKYLNVLLDMFTEFYEGIDSMGQIFPDPLAFVNILVVMEKVNYPTTKLAPRYVALTDIMKNADAIMNTPQRTWIFDALMQFTPPIMNKKQFMPQVAQVSIYNKETETHDIGNFLNDATQHSDPQARGVYSGNLKLLTADILPTIAAWGQPEWLEMGQKHILPMVQNAEGFAHLKKILMDSIKFFTNPETGQLENYQNVIQASEVLIACNAISCWGSKKQQRMVKAAIDLMQDSYDALEMPSWKEGDGPEVVVNYRLPRVMIAWAVLAKYR